MNEISAEAFEFYREFIEQWAKYRGGHYLEIGCHSGGLTARIAKLPNIVFALGIDKVSHADWDGYEGEHLNLEFLNLTSDEYFMQEQKLGGFDTIFIDADHSSDQVYRDVENALELLADEGLILVHDTLPPSEEFKQFHLCGDAYKAINDLRTFRHDLQVFTIPVIYGLTLISKVPVVE